jgi:hypothetical protein
MKRNKPSLIHTHLGVKAKIYFAFMAVLHHIQTEKNEIDYTNNFIDFINFL